MTMAAFSQQNTLASCNPASGKYLACSMMYRGDVALNEAI